MEIVVRPTFPEEYRTACNAMCRALLTAPPDDERWALSEPSWSVTRSFSAWDGADCVGHAGHFHAKTTVPGGAFVDTGAVTRVGVLATHTRRGAATRLMHAVIDDALDQGWPLMTLRASETVIYRRYGFGIANDHTFVEINPARARPVIGAAAGSFRSLAPEEIRTVTDDLYSRARHRRPGLMTRPEPWLERMFRATKAGKENGMVVVHLDEGGQPDGYVHYVTSWGQTFLTGASGVVHDLFALSDDVELALWGHVFSVDLVERWTSSLRPVDDIIIGAVADRRAYKVTSQIDELWIRLLDVGAALAARSYASMAGDGLVVEVVDPLVDVNNGRWHVSAGGVTRTDDAADLVADIDAVSALYLGGKSWLNEAAVGRVRQGPAATGGDHRDTLVRADHLFSVKPLPFGGTLF